MQLFAFEHTHLVSSTNAVKGKDYLCPECAQTLRVRKGDIRCAHFYHLRLSPTCRQSGKSVIHLQTQLYVASQFPKKEVFLEKPFPSIRRIADVVWNRIIFEIQCSPISLEEIRGRYKDYESLGYALIWIFHTKTFNRIILSAAENYARKKRAFYTNIDRNGNGFIFHQKEKLVRGQRKILSPPIRIELSREFKFFDTSQQNFPSAKKNKKRFLQKLKSGRTFLKEIFSLRKKY